MCGILLQPVVPRVTARLLDALCKDVRGLGAAWVGRGREQLERIHRVMLLPKEVEVVGGDGRGVNVDGRR